MDKIKDVRVLTVSAFLVAIAIVLGFFKIPITEFVEIRFQFIPIALGGALFGPAMGGIIGMLADILGYVVKPTGAYFPGFTISSIVVGVIYGLFFYRKKLTLPRVIMAELTVTIIRSIVLNTINLSILYGEGFLAILSTRILKTIVMFPVNVVILFLSLTLLPRLLPKEIRLDFLTSEEISVDKP